MGNKIIIIVSDESDKKAMEENKEFLNELKYSVDANDIEFHNYDENDEVSLRIMASLDDYSVPLIALVSEQEKKVCKVDDETLRPRYCVELKEMKETDEHSQ